MSSPAQKFISLKGGKKRSLRHPVDLKLLNKRFSPKITATIRDLSTEGAFIETVPELLGRVLDLEFAFPGQLRTYHITGKVVWCRNTKGEAFGMGMQFLRFLRGTPAELEKTIAAWKDLKSPPASIDLHVVPAAKPEIAAAPFVQIPISLSELEIEQAVTSVLDSLRDA